MKLSRYGSSSDSSSISPSRASTCRASTIGTGILALSSSRMQRSEPTLNSSFCTRASVSASRGASPSATATPICRAQLVDRAVGLDPERVLRHPLPAAEAGGSVVARAGVDPGDSRHSRTPF